MKIIFFFKKLLQTIAYILNEDEIVFDSIYKSEQYKIHHQFDNNAKKYQKSRKNTNINILGIQNFWFDPISQNVFSRWFSKAMMDIIYFY